MEKALQGDEGEHLPAWAEFEALFMGLMAEKDSRTAGNAIALLPHLIIARQRIDRAAGSKPNHSARIAELNERLDKLCEPENERAYFRTLTEIRRLEHGARPTNGRRR